MKVFERNKAKENDANDKKSLVKKMIDGSILTHKDFLHQIPYILFLTLIAIVYIGNRYHAEKILRETINITSELKELRAEAITSASKLMFKSKQTEVAKMVEQNGLELKEAVEPPYKLIIKK